MRIAAVDAALDDARVERAVAVALARAPDRLLLFGAAARCAARLAARDLEKRDERFLDVAAAFVLDAPPSASASDVPSRARLAVPLLEIGVAVGVEAAPLSSSSRAIEMIGVHLCIAVPARDGLDADEIDHAALWVCGGAGAFSLEQVKARSVLCPGDVTAGGFVAVVDAQPAELRIARLDADGALVDARAAAVSASTRMQVLG